MNHLHLRFTSLIRFFCFCLLLLLLVGCQLLTPASTPVPTLPPEQLTPFDSPTAVQLPQATDVPTAAPPEPLPSITPTTFGPYDPLPSPTGVEIPPANPTEPSTSSDQPLPTHPNLSETLTPGGPWLVIWTSQGLFAVNEDGSGLTRLTDENPDREQTLSLAASPDGRSLAYITGNPDRVHGLKLNLMTLPEGKTRLITALTNKSTEPDNDAMLTPKVEAVRAIIDVKSIAWSPDGKTLAFIGVQDGPSADLYTYTVSTGKINRLTDGPSQAYGPSWSPDGKYIVQYGVNTFGTGAGYSMSGAWAARADGSAVIDLGKPGGSGETLVGWLDNDSFVTYSWTPVCGPENLRVVNINEKTQSRLVRGCFGNAAMAANGAIMVVGSSDMGSELSGISMIGPGNVERRQLSKEDSNRVEIIPDSGEFLVATNTGFIVYSPDGQVMSTSPHVACSYGMGVGTFGMIYGWTCSGNNPSDTPGVWINGPGIPEYQVFKQSAYLPTMGWHNTLLFFNDSTLYRAFFFDYAVEQVVTLPGDPQAVEWVRRLE